MRNTIQLFIRLGIFALSFAVLQVHAYRVEPLIGKVEPSGNKSTMRLLITNTGASALVVELEALAVSIDEQGNQVQTPEDNDIMIFPMQTSVPPGRQQAVQIRYVGEQGFEQGKLYAIKIAQLPVNAAVSNSQGTAASEVKIGVNFLSYVLVESNQMRADLSISDVSKTDNGELQFTAQNVGSGTALLRELSWDVSDASGKVVEIEPKDVDTGTFGALIAQAPKRTITIKSPAIQNLTGDLTIKPQ